MEACFQLEGKEYCLPEGPADIIRLPDGRLFLIGFWHETHPSKPGGLTAIEEADVASRKVVDVTLVE